MGENGLSALFRAYHPVAKPVARGPPRTPLTQGAACYGLKPSRREKNSRRETVEDRCAPSLHHRRVRCVRTARGRSRGHYPPERCAGRAASGHKLIRRAAGHGRAAGKQGHCDFSPCNFTEKNPWLDLSSQTRSRQKRMAISRSSLCSLGGLRRRHAPPPEAGALHGARHGASGAVPPVGGTASFGVVQV